MKKLLLMVVLIGLLVIVLVFAFTKSLFSELNKPAGNQISNTNSGGEVFTDPANNLSFTYPKEFSLVEAASATPNWRQGTITLGELLSGVIIPRTFEPQTNFSEAKFTVGKNQDVKNCFSVDQAENVKPVAVTINNIDYQKFVFRDAGAGNFYETASYRTIHNNVCYAIEYTVHSTNIGNYSPDQGIKEFDQTKIVSILEALVKGFKFLN